MKKIIIIGVLAFCASLTASAQIAPQASPISKLEQKIGLTDVTINYSRPGKKGREVFEEVVPFGEIWRTGANENTKFTCGDAIVFGKDTLKAGTYALFTKPGKEQWEIIFYTDATNWGTPEVWSDSKVALKTTAPVVHLKETVENFTINIDAMDNNGAKLVLAWDKTQVSVPFTVPTDSKVMANIKKTMAGPSANDYNSAALYYLNAKKDLAQALEWSTKACEMRNDAYWMLRTKSLIQAELGDKKAAIESAKAGLVLAEKGKNADYVKMFNDSIKEWSK
ncbi:MAG: DUF2911 domain-containing protein [Fluviicola sp.]|nr:DUF2911 domain-containing protein [Fluviicola sp.]